MKVVVISGGSEGLGKEIAKTLSLSHKVVILSTDKEKLEKAAQEIGCDSFVCDVADPKQVDAAVIYTLDKYSQIDCLINSAGVWIQGELETNKVEDIKKVLEVNTLGTVYLTKAVIPVMKKQKNGLIINIISQAGFYGKAERSVYNASKFAVTGFSKSIQPELAKYGIAVTGLYPGKMKTNMFEKMGIEKSMDNALEVSEVAKTVEFIVNMNPTTVFPEIGIKHIGN